jgi:hypothetical protein
VEVSPELVVLFNAALLIAGLFFLGKVALLTATTTSEMGRYVAAAAIFWPTVPAALLVIVGQQIRALSTPLAPG